MHERFEHTADLGLRIRAANLDELFAEAGRALTATLVTDVASIRPTTRRQFDMDGDDIEYLLVDWLREVLYVFDVERLLLSKFQVTVCKEGLTAIAQGEVFDSNRHELQHEIKAVTYHALKVQETDAGWLAEVIVDI